MSLDIHSSAEVERREERRARVARVIEKLDGYVGARMREITDPTSRSALLADVERQNLIDVLMENLS